MNTGAVLFANNATSRLFAAVDAASASVRVSAGDGGKFPQPLGDGSNWFMVTLEDRRNNTVEICKCTGRSGDILNVTRGQEGTTAKAFDPGANVSNRMTAGMMATFFTFNGYSMVEADARFVNVTGDTMTSPLVLPGAPTTDNQAATKRYVDDVSIDEAPTDGRAYGRQSIGWVPISIGMAEPPVDGKIYGRQDLAWAESILKTTFDAEVTNRTNADTALDGRVTGTETKNTTQDGRLTAVEGVNTTQDGRLTAVETKNTTQDNRLTATEGVNTTQDNRLTAVEGVNTTQDATIALKAPIASPTFTGDPKAPTPALGDNDTSVATSKFVRDIWRTDTLDAATDWNTITSPGPFPALLGTANANAPAASAYFHCLVVQFQGNLTQIAIPYGHGGSLPQSIWYRGWHTSGGWSAWFHLLTDAPSDGLTYGRKNAAWSTIVGGAVISDTPPPGPLQAGQLWWESDTGNLFLWYVDANSSQWVQINNAPVSGLTAQTRNRIVNPAMQIGQELATGTYYGVGSYPADQWILGAAAAPAVPAMALITTAANLTPNGSNVLSLGSGATAKAALATGDYVLIRQTMEGKRIRDFNWGTASARPAVLRFWASASAAGKYALSLRNFAGTVCFVKEFDLPASAWTEVKISIPACTIGTWVVDNAAALIIDFVFAGGTSFDTTTPGVWSSGNLLKTAACANLLAVANQYVSLGDVGLYLDPLNTGLAPRWEMPDEAQELIACKRYWQTLNLYGYSYNAAGNNWLQRTILPVEMRIVPATLAVGTPTYNNASNLVGSVHTTTAVSFVWTTTALGAASVNWTASINARM